MKRLRKINKKLLVILILFISIGFAYLTRDLTLSGISSIFGNTWDVHFDNVVVSEGSVEANTPVIGNDLTSVSFTVEFSTPGDFYEFTVDAVNEGSIDAMLNTFTSSELDESVANLLEYTVTYADGNPLGQYHLLCSGDLEKFKIRVEYKLDIQEEDLPLSNQSISLSFGVTYIQSDNNAIDGHPICRRATYLHQISAYTFGQLGTAGTLSTGDAFDCDVNDDGFYDPEDERFYYVSPMNADDNSEYASLIYYSNVTDGVSNNNSSSDVFKFCSGSVWCGPNVAYLELPTVLQWSNSKLLSNQSRQIKTVNGNSFVSYDGNNFSLPIFVYSNSASRLLTYNEMVYSCGPIPWDPLKTGGYLNSCSFFYEGLQTPNNNSISYYYWMETYSNSIYYVCKIIGNYSSYSDTQDCSFSCNSLPTSESFGVRPVIDVLKSNISY